MPLALVWKVLFDPWQIQCSLVHRRDLENSFATHLNDHLQQTFHSVEYRTSLEDHGPS